MDTERVPVKYQLGLPPRALWTPCVQQADKESPTWQGNWPRLAGEGRGVRHLLRMVKGTAFP